MTEAETKGCLLLMTQLWMNFKAPATEAEIQAAVGAWMMFFSAVSASTVTRAIYEISATGAEFAPNVGQIYARIKANKAALPEGRTGVDADGFTQNVTAWARLMGYRPPEGLTPIQLNAWALRVRERERNK